ncbi:hypothetical protein RRG08_060262 [Elysia crispata]|uniref:Uncharacterized protein n=1 Tax=Elysia crispata TaxID=231223 RepID=A0AAE1B7A7_9GAST|nr:hypothetical protein RRG08_060262 [Elysia crispata]
MRHQESDCCIDQVTKCRHDNFCQMYEVKTAQKSSFFGTGTVKMANHLFVFTLFFVSISIIGIHGDDIDDILSSTMGTSLEDLQTMAGYPSRRSYDPFGNPRGVKPKIRELPDLFNFVFGLPGHIIERAGRVVHNAFQSLVDGFMSSKYKLRSPAGARMFGPQIGHDDLFDDLDPSRGDFSDDLFGGPTGGYNPLGFTF